MYALSDIAAMKLSAIANSGERLKDFVDIAWMSTKMTVVDMLKAFSDKYQFSYLPALKSLLYFEDINFKTKIELTNNKKFSWKKIEKRIHEMVKYENEIFETEPI
jgi:hypothetical protein